MSIVGLQGGPRAGWVFTDADMQIRIDAAKAMGHTDPLAHPSAWALGYELRGARWYWTLDDGQSAAAQSASARWSA